MSALWNIDCQVLRYLRLLGIQSLTAGSPTGQSRRPSVFCCTALYKCPHHIEVNLDTSHFFLIFVQRSLPSKIAVFCFEGGEVLHPKAVILVQASMQRKFATSYLSRGLRSPNIECPRQSIPKACIEHSSSMPVTRRASLRRILYGESS